jgi:hypothetical protein
MSIPTHFPVFSKHTTRRLSQGIFSPRTRVLSRPRLSEPVVRRYISRKWTFGVFNVVRERLHKGNEGRSTRRCFLSNERKRRKTKHLGFFPCISLLSLSYISSLLSIMHKQTFYAGTRNEPWSAYRIFLHLVYSFLILSLDCQCMELSFDTRTWETRLGCAPKKSRVSVSKSKRVSNPKTCDMPPSFQYVPNVRVHIL